MGRKRQNLLAGMAHAVGRQGHDLLDDGFHPAAFGAMTRWRIRAEQALLPDHSQDVLYAMAPRVSTRSLVAHFPEGKRSRPRSVWISAWNCSWVAWSAYSAITALASMSPGRVVSHFHSDLRQEQMLAVGQRRTLGEAEDPAHRNGADMGAFLPDGHALAGTGGLPYGIGIRTAALRDGLHVMAPAIPFHQEAMPSLRVSELSRVKTSMSRATQPQDKGVAGALDRFTIRGRDSSTCGRNSSARASRLWRRVGLEGMARKPMDMAKKRSSRKRSMVSKSLFPWQSSPR